MFSVGTLHKRKVFIAFSSKWCYRYIIVWQLVLNILKLTMFPWLLKLGGTVHSSRLVTLTEANSFDKQMFAIEINIEKRLCK